ncbi:MAG: ABC transporter ATP-binding protein [Spirochaetia bacterium]|nr:MAG: ABC transporter ATP-binding protein [Spirochaetia bacterium]
MPNEILLQLQDISVHYGGVKALDGVNVAIDEGEIVALMGPNGAGKSTILKTIFGLAPIDSGSVLFYEKPIAPVSWKVVKMGIAFVPQGRRVFSNLTIEENLEMGGFAIGDKSELKRRTEEIFDLFPDLKQKRKQKANTLSGGQQQMLALARGLMIEPKVLLLDEPTLGLAPKVIKEVFEKIVEINQRRKTAIMIVEHNIKSVLNVAHRAYILNKGKIVLSGAVKDIQNSETLEKVFMGKFE